MPYLDRNTLDTNALRISAGSFIYQQAQSLYRENKVRLEEITDWSAFFTILSSQHHFVEISQTEYGLYLECDCKFGKRSMLCEHVVAAALYLEDYLRKNSAHFWKAQLNSVLKATAETGQRKPPRRYLLFFSLQSHTSYTARTEKIVPYTLPLNALPEGVWTEENKLDPAKAALAVQDNPNLSLNLKTPYQSIRSEGCVNCPPESITLANLILERNRSYSYYYANYPIADLLALLASQGAPLFLGDSHNPLEKLLVVYKQTGGLRIDVSRDEQGTHLTAKMLLPDRELVLKDTQCELISASPSWIRVGSIVVRLDNSILPEQINSWLDKPELLIPPEDESEFLEKYYLPLARQVNLGGQAIIREEVEAPAVPRLYLNDQQGSLQVQLRFGYGEVELPYDARMPAESIQGKADAWTLVHIKRQPDAEEKAYETLVGSAYGLKRDNQASQPGSFALRARVHPVDFLLYTVPKLTQAGYEVYGEESLKTARVNRNKPVLSFNVSSGIDWFDVQATVNFGDLQVSIKEMRRLLRKNDRFVKLADGTMGEIPPDWIERYKHLFALGEENEDALRFSHHHLTMVDELLAGADRVRLDPEFERRRQHLRSFKGITPVPIPQGFNGELRPYQKAGYDWLNFLQEYHFGGCLADDMGLGKTIQVLAFFQSLRERSQKPPSNGKTGVAEPLPASLVVVPRSLLFNWQREAALFTPALRILEYSQPTRPTDVSLFNDYDLVLTTYGILLRDVERLKTYTFNYVLLDESQAIKNPLAQTARAARQLNTRFRLVLTGTPMENSSVELWSQFAFLNPGLLGSLEYFKSEFATPIEKKGDAGQADFLRKMVFPFILRRTKDQVAPELPPRSERVLYADMEPGQRKLYNRARDYYRGYLLGMIESKGINNTRMKILEGLLRLRQVCNHPRLFDPKFRGESGKFELLMETLETLHAEGHKALVFSQFVQMLRLVRDGLDNRKLPYTYLDGQTRDRQARVDAFQNDPKLPFFLISLKAGGVGLNLTAADYVLHIDPWWNPAVEMQASDRTHRIGQDKPVLIYKMITRDSVEEKVLQLQERKKNLVDQLITSEGGFFKDLTPEDVNALFS